MKVKLYKGPFNGKSYDSDGRTELMVRGHKPMNRRQRWEWQTGRYNESGFVHAPFPITEARYRMVIRVIQTGHDTLIQAPAVHPDGSYFYEYVEGSRKDY